MSDDVKKEATEKVQEAAQAAGAAAQAVEAAATAKGVKVRSVLGALQRHPLGVVAAVGAAVALVEIEVAVGMLAGIGATALLVTKSGPEARQEVVAKSKAAIERARVALASRAKAQPTPGMTESPSAQPQATTA